MTAARPGSAAAPPAPTWLVYVLRCADGSLYTGITNDLERRRRSHLAGSASKYTRTRLPIVVVWRESQPDRRAALRREASIKKLGRAAKEALVAGAGAQKDTKPGDESAVRTCMF